jgi:hypothetical protein
MQESLGIKFEKELKTKYEVLRNTLELGLIFPLSCGICVVCEKPEEIHRNKVGQLHNANGPAVKYADYEVFALNGVRLKREIVMIQAEKLDPALILTENNAEVRRELVRKIGIERVALKLGAKVLDKSEDGVYELLDINMGDGRTRPYLKMRNPSIATWHLEGVHPECKTVIAALQWRNQTDATPRQLT